MCRSGRRRRVWFSVCLGFEVESDLVVEDQVKTEGFHGWEEHRVWMLLLRRFLEIALLDRLERRGGQQILYSLLREAAVVP